MRIVLLSGGSGKRLWPLSNNIRSKAFLKLLSTEAGHRESMIQRVCSQLESAGLLSSSVIVTHASQVEITQNHIGHKVPLISEPYRRGTFSAVALAASYCHSVLQDKTDEIVCVIPVDAYVDKEFFERLHRFPDVLARSGAELALLGTVPDQPSTQFGYIVPKGGEVESDEGDESYDGVEGYYKVDYFVEKPEEERAAQLIQAHALWNCGVFAFSLGFLLSYLQNTGRPIDYEAWLQQYEQLPDLSFDREIAEKTGSLAVIPYIGSWNDLGSWESLSAQLDSPVIGPGERDTTSTGTHVVNELPYPIQVIGAPDLIVAASPDGILVAGKSSANEIKGKVGGSSARTMMGEKRWGTYRILDYAMTAEGAETLIRRIQIQPGKHTSYHEHRRRSEISTVLCGSGELMMDGVLRPISVGDVLHIPPEAKHAIRARTLLELVEVQLGTDLWTEDSIRTALTWEDTMRHCSEEYSS